MSYSYMFSIRFWCFNDSFYLKQHSTLTLYGKSIAEHIGISEYDLDILTHYTLDYLNDYNDSLDLEMKINGVNREVYTDDEKAHMVDVKNLYLSVMKIFYIAIIVTIFTVFKIVTRKISFSQLFYGYKKVLFGTLFIVAILGTWILMDFDGFWTSFHHLFFMGNDLWLLDLRKDVLIMIVPPQFFNNLVIRIVLTFVIALIALYAILHILSKKELKND